MNVQEMHIEINLSSQKIRSNYYRKFLDSEIDWLLNKAVDRFIKDRIKSDQDSLGFDATQIDLDALRTLSVIDRQLPLFNVEDEAVRSELPGDYSYMIDSYSNTVESCDTNNYKAVNKPTAGTLYLYAFKLANSTKGSAPYYTDMKLQLNAVTIFDAVALPGLPDKTELFTARNYIMDQAFKYVAKGLQTNPVPPIDFYWEEFGGYRLDNAIIAVCTAAQPGLNQLTIDGTNIAAIASMISRNFYPSLNVGKLASNSLIKGPYRSLLRTSTFAKSKSANPITALAGNQIKVYHDTKFIVSKLKVSYIRKPARINLLLSQNCDLAPEYHREICDRVTLDIKELTMSPDWEIKMRDMMLNKD